MEETEYIEEVEQEQQPDPQPKPKKVKVKEFAARIKQKYPDYKDIDDLELTQKIIAKYPEYKEQVDLTPEVKKKVASVDIGASSLEAGNALSYGEDGEEIPTIEMYTTPNGEMVEANPIALSKKYNELVSRKKQGATIGGSSFAMGTTGTEVTDEEALKSAKKLKEDFPNVDVDNIASELKDIPDEVLANVGKELMQDREQNNPLYQRKLANIKWRNQFEDKIIEDVDKGNITPDDYNRLKESIDRLPEFTGSGDFTNQRTAIQSLAKDIDAYGGADRDKIKENFAIEVSKVYGNAYNNNFDKTITDTPESKYLNSDEQLALQYIKDVSPEKAGQYDRLMIDPKTLKDNPDAEKGYNHLKQTLEETGIGLQQNSVTEELNNLKRIANEYGGLTPEQIQKATDLEKKQEELSQKRNELDKKYPDRIEDKVDDALQEIMGQKITGLNYFGGTGFNAIKNTGQGIWESVSTPFMSDASNTMRELSIMGESLENNEIYRKTDKNKSLLTDTMVIEPDLQKQIDLVKNNGVLSNDEKEMKIYRLLKDNTDKFGRVPIKGGKFNVNPSSIMYGLSDLGTTLLPFIALEAVTGGGATAGAARKFMSTFTAAAATSFHDEYASALLSGKSQSEAYKEAMGMTAISSLAMAGAATPSKIKAMANPKTSAGKLILSMSDDAIQKVLDKGVPKSLKGIGQAIKERANAVPKQFAGGLKTGAEFEVAMNLANEAKSAIYDTEIDREQNFKQSLIGIGNFGIMGVGLGQMGYKSPTELQKSALLQFGAKPKEYISVLDGLKKDGKVTPAEYDHRKSLIESAEAASKSLPPQLNEKQKADYLYQTVIKNEANKGKSDLPPKQAAEAEKTALVADHTRGLILEAPTDKQLDDRKTQLEKKLEPKKDADGKAIDIPEKEKLDYQAELEAVNNELDTRKSFQKTEMKRKDIQPIGDNVPTPTEVSGKDVAEIEKQRQDEIQSGNTNARLIHDTESAQPLTGADENMANKMIEKTISKAKNTDDVHSFMTQLGWNLRGKNIDDFNQFVQDRIDGKTDKTFEEWRNENSDRINKINEKYDKQLADLEKQQSGKDVVVDEGVVDKPENYVGMFNPKKTGVIGLDELLKDDGGYNYFYKGVSGEVVMMSPDAYLKKVRDDITRSDKDLGLSDEKKSSIIEGIDKGDKINMPYLSLKENGQAHKQEGRNRAVIARERGEKLIPVLVEKDISFNDKIAKGNEYVKSAIKEGAATKEEVLSKLKEQGLHRDAIRFIDENFNDKQIKSLSTKPEIKNEEAQATKIPDTKEKTNIADEGTGQAGKEAGGGKEGKYEAKARKLAEKIMASETPDWLKIDDPNVSKKGAGAEEIKKALADATIKMGKLLDKGVEFSEAVKESVKDLVNMLGEGMREKIEAGFAKDYEGKLNDLSGIKKGLVSDKIIEGVDLERVSDKDMMDMGRKILDTGEVKPEALVTKIITDGKGVLTPTEVVGLITYKRDIDNAVQDVYKQINERVANGEDIGTLGVEAKNLERQINDFDVMAVITAQQQSMAFRLRQRMLDKEYNVVTQIEKYKANNGGEIPADVEARFREVDKELKEVKAKLVEAEKKAAQKEGQDAVDNIKESVSREKKYTEEELQSELKKERASLRVEKKEKVHKAIDDMMDKWAKKISPEHLRGTDTKGVNADKVFKSVGAIMKKAYDAGELTTKIVEDAVKYVSEKLGNKDWGIEEFKNENWDEKLRAASEKKAKDKPTINEDGTVSIPNQMLRGLVKRGVTDIEGLAKEVHEQVKKDLPDITERQVRDYITDYGKKVNPTADALQTQVNTAKRVGRLLSELEDLRRMNKVQYLAKYQKLKPSESKITEREHELKRQIRALGKDIAKLDNTKTDAEQLRLAKERVKTNIEDLSRKIKNKDFAKPVKKPPVTDTELQTLKAKQESLKEEYDKEQYKLELKNRPFWVKVEDGAKEATNGLLRGLIASLDFSAPLVQGTVRLFTDLGKSTYEIARFKKLSPNRSINAIGTMFKHFFSEKAADNYMTKLKVSEAYPFLKASGLAIGDKSGRISVKEGMFISNWIKQIWNYTVAPVLTVPISVGTKFNVKKAYNIAKAIDPYVASQRAFDGYLTSVRVNSMLDISKYIERRGYKFETDTKEFQKAADFINTTTMRGSLGKAEQAASWMDIFLFAPRKVIAEVKMFTPYAFVYYSKMPKVVRQKAIKDLGAFLGTFITANALLWAATKKDDDEEDNFWNANSTDFLTHKIGDKRYGVGGGIKSILVFQSRFWSAKFVDQYGTDAKLGERYGKEINTRFDLLESYVIGKSSPALNIAIQKMKERAGIELETTDVLQKATMPMWAQDLKEMYKEDPATVNAILTGLSLFGMNLRVVGEKKTGWGTEDKENPIYKPFIDAKVELPKTNPKSIEVDFKEGKAINLSDKPQDIQDKYISTKDKYVREMLKDLYKGDTEVYVDEDGRISIPLTNEDKQGKDAVLFKKLTPDQLKEAVSLIGGSATTKTKDEMFPKD